MAKWFLRERGTVLGPFTANQILEMRDRGTVASYHEVSTDQRLWKLIDDVPELGAAGTREPERETKPERHAAGAGSSRTALWIGLALGGAVVLIVGALLFGAVLYFVFGQK